MVDHAFEEWRDPRATRLREILGANFKDAAARRDGELRVVDDDEFDKAVSRLLEALRNEEP